MAAKNFTPSKLIVAIRAGLLNDVISAIDNGADIEEADMHGFVGLPLRTACFEGNVEIVRELLRHGVDINAPAGDGPGAPLRLAKRRGHQAIAELLLLQGTQMCATTETKSAETDCPPEVSSAVLEPRASLVFETPPEHLIEDVDITTCYDLDTNLLTLDLMRLHDEEPEYARATSESKTPGLWKTGH